MSFLFAAWRCCYGAAHVEPRMENSLCAEFHIRTQSVRNRAERTQNMTKPALTAVLLLLLLLLFITSRMGVLPLQYYKCDVITRRWPCWTSVSIVIFFKHNSLFLWYKVYWFYYQTLYFYGNAAVFVWAFYNVPIWTRMFFFMNFIMSLWQQQW